MICTKLVCDLDDAVAQHLVADGEALFKLLHDLALAVGLILDVHDGVVEVRVEGLAHGLDGLDAELLERGCILLHDHLESLAGISRIYDPIILIVIPFLDSSYTNNYLLQTYAHLLDTVLSHLYKSLRIVE